MIANITQENQDARIRPIFELGKSSKLWINRAEEIAKAKCSRLSADISREIRRTTAGAAQKSPGGIDAYGCRTKYKRLSAQEKHDGKRYKGALTAIEDPPHLSSHRINKLTRGNWNQGEIARAPIVESLTTDGETARTIIGALS